MSIGAVAERFGLATHVLRHWEAMDLLAPDRDSAGRRRYRVDHLTCVAVILRAQEAGLSLDTIRSLAATADPAKAAGHPARGGRGLVLPHRHRTVLTRADRVRSGLRSRRLHLVRTLQAPLPMSRSDPAPEGAGSLQPALSQQSGRQRAQTNGELGCMVDAAEP